MQAEIILSLDKELVERAEEFSRKAGKSLPELIAEYLEVLSRPRPQDISGQTPLVKSLRGILKGSELTEENYRGYLEEKYL